MLSRAVFEVKGKRIGLFNVEGTLYAIDGKYDPVHIRGRSAVG
jgi:hypothetical protein